MKNCFWIFPCIVFLLVNCKAPVSQYSVTNAHSHNDYENSVPFTRAYIAGFGSIEADVFAMNGTLAVAHDKKEIDPQRTLKHFYLEPLLAGFKADDKRRVRLLVDIKEDHQQVLKLLVQELSPLYPYLSTSDHPNRLTILISGERPLPAAYANYPSFILFDDNLVNPHDTEEWKRVGLVSLPFDKISKWNGAGKIDQNDEKKLQHIIDSVHTLGKPIRFWAAPDTEVSHLLQMKIRADYIGTDKIDETALYLSGLRKKRLQTQKKEMLIK